MKKNLSIFRLLIVVLFSGFLSGCQAGYIVKNGYHQAKILSARVPNAKAISNPNLDPEVKHKLALVEEVRAFAKNKLGLEITDQYSTYVQLDRPYVTYTVSAAEKYKLKHYLWSYPLVGELPYKGFFTEKEAKDEAEEMKNKGFDTFVRGVSAYSTLGWFEDPVLSSMMRYKDHHLVDLIIHESVHATLYIDSEADFNEQLATFMGAKGTEIFYREKEGKDSKTLERIKQENEDQEKYSAFISREIKNLEKWYKENKGSVTEESRRRKFKEISERYISDLKPKLETRRFPLLETGEFNNAYLMLQKTYVEDLSAFEKAYEKHGSDFKKFLEFAKSLEDADDPKLALFLF